MLMNKCKIFIIIKLAISALGVGQILADLMQIQQKNFVQKLADTYTHKYRTVFLYKLVFKN